MSNMLSTARNLEEFLEDKKEKPMQMVFVDGV